MYFRDISKKTYGQALGEKTKRSSDSHQRISSSSCPKESVSQRQETAACGHTPRQPARQPCSSDIPVSHPQIFDTQILPLVLETPPPSQETPTVQKRPHPAIQRQPEKRVELRPQVIITGKESRVKIIQRVSKATRDNPPTQDEMDLFWFEMDYWERLDARVAAALVQAWNDASRLTTILVKESSCESSWNLTIWHAE